MGKQLRRKHSRIRFALIALMVLAVAWTVVALVQSSPASADEVPGPILLAGSDCDENGPFIQYRVSNESDGDETLSLAIDNEVAIGSARVESSETKRGRIEWRGNAASSVVLEARWATNEKAPISTISVAPNPCVTTSAEDFTGPAFMAGTDCRADNALVRWWMANSADEHRLTYVSISNEEGTFGETIWPSDGSSEMMFAGAQTGGAIEVPIDYPPGTRIRMSGWAEGTFGIAETWTQMVVPFCGPSGTQLAADTTLEAAPGTTAPDPIPTAVPTSAPVTSPEVATTIPTGDGTTTTTGPPGATTSSTRPPPTTTGPPGATTTTTRSPTTTTTTTTTTSPPTGIAAPVFLAGADCNANGAYIRYRVTNNNTTAQTLQVTFNGSTRVSSVSVGSGQTKWGTFSPSGGANEPRPVVASWVGQAGSAAPTLLMRGSICEAGLPQPARGPSFVAGQDCSGATPIVRWWMKNSASTTQRMNVTVTKDNNNGERIMWPGSGGMVDVDAAVQTAGSFTLPSGYNSSGQEVRVRGWWRGIDANAHNRVGIVVESCR